MGNGFSLAWRVLDAAGWGVPQRRKRIFLVADFAGERAAEILFDENRLHGHPSPGGETGQGTAAALVFRNMVMELNSNSPDERKLLFSAAVQAIRDFMAGKQRSMRYKFSADAYELMHKVRLMDGLTEK